MASMTLIGDISLILFCFLQIYTQTSEKYQMRLKFFKASAVDSQIYPLEHNKAPAPEGADAVLLGSVSH